MDDLGDVREIATVAVNGKELRTLWHAPFLLRIDPALHAGDNELSIRVTNLWPNRLIGDQQPAEKAHYTKTNIHVYSKDSPLLPSGLLSPVTLRVTEKGRLSKRRFAGNSKSTALVLFGTHRQTYKEKFHA